MWNPGAEFEVRASKAGTAVSAVRNAFRELAPDIAVDKPVTMGELVVSSMGRERMVAMLAAFFALLTLALTGIAFARSSPCARRPHAVGDADRAEDRWTSG